MGKYLFALLLLCASRVIASRPLATEEHGLIVATSSLLASDRSDAIAPTGDEDQFCYDPIYRKRTLKVIKESPFIGLFKDLGGETRFEASGINIGPKGNAYVIFDNLRTMGRVSLDLKFMGPENILISEKGLPETESQFEGLAYMPKSDTFLVVRETFVKKTDPADDSGGESHELLLSQVGVKGYNLNPLYPYFFHLIHELPPPHPSSLSSPLCPPHPPSSPTD